MDFCWIVNNTDKPIEDYCLMQEKKWISLKPGCPIHVLRETALKLVSEFPYTIKICVNPSRYFKTRKMKYLIIRDNGIGDLLLLEPVLRALKEDGNKTIHISTMNPDVYIGNPCVDSTIQMSTKDKVPIKYSDYDAAEDIRNWSEQHPERAKLHRTDIYALKFGIDLGDKEPRIYLGDDDKPVVKRKKGLTYIGLQFDASHSYRRCDLGSDFIRYICSRSETNRVVVFGAYDFVKIPPECEKQVIDLQGKTTIRQVINVVRVLDGMIGVDSGIMHIALTLHIPTVGLFSIIRPDLRLKYYTGPYKAMIKDLPCIGCGSTHMSECKHGNKRENPSIITPCMAWDPAEVYEALAQLSKSPVRTFRSESGVPTSILVPAEPARAVPGAQEGPRAPGLVHPDRRFTLAIMVQDEEKNLPRFIDLVMKNRNIGRTIAIDGGSKDKTVELLRAAGAFVYVHPYDRGYHDIQAVQRNYSCSFVKDGERVLIMDIDECFSPELEAALPEILDMEDEYIQLSRRTFSYYADIKDPSKAIKNYPDWQPRVFKWNRRFKWIGSPHHNVYNCPPPRKVQKDIIHFEREGKDRDALEKYWSELHLKTKEIYK